jgi:hypothetical protein
MSFERNNPRDGLRNFLERAEQDAWIASYKWVSADSFLQLREKLGRVKEGWSRSHKRSTDGTWWALEVEGHEGTVVGVDLEILISRPLLTDPEWITTRLNIARSSTPQKILEEWASREAAFKALAPNNAGVLLSHFRRTAPNTLTAYTPAGERSVQVRAQWGGRWVSSIAWKSSL